MANIYLVDLNGVSGTSDKTRIGDVEAYRVRYEKPQMCLAEAGIQKVECGEPGSNQYSMALTFSNQNPFGTAASSLAISSTTPGVTILSPVGGNHNFLPVLGIGQSTSIPLQISAPGLAGQKICFSAKLAGDPRGSDWCCPGQEICVELPVCDADCVKEAVIKCVNGLCTLDVSNSGPLTIAQVELSSPSGAVFTPNIINTNILSGNSATLNFSVAPATTNSAVVSFSGPKIGDTAWMEGCCKQVVKWKAGQGGGPVDLDVALPFLSTRLRQERRWRR